MSSSIRSFILSGNEHEHDELELGKVDVTGGVVLHEFMGRDSVNQRPRDVTGEVPLLKREVGKKKKKS